MIRRLFLLGWALMLSATLALASSQEQKNNEEEAKDDDAFYHHTGINDVNAIGNRNVGCNRGLGNWYTLEAQVRMGQEFAQEVEQTSHLITDPVVNEYVNRVAQNLVRNSDTKLPLTVKILDVEEPNAFALPGGYMFVNAGTLLLADDESELAGVMAHEIAHVAACHTARQATRGNLASLAMIPVMVMTGGLAGLGVNEAANLAVPAMFMKFGRTFEAQADYLGVQYAYKAGYDPVGMVNFFEKVQAIMEKKRTGYATKLLHEDHPEFQYRIGKTQHEIATILPPRDQYIVSTSEFDQAKKRVTLIMKHKLPKDNKDENPQLRRTVDEKNPQQNDDRPVIKRKPSN